MSDKHSTLTQSRLRELLRYEPETGNFVRLVTTSSNAKAGMIAGSAKKDGYIKIRIDGKIHSAHRLAWLYMTGDWPEHHIDHVNGDSYDNRWKNLRNVDRQTNLQNQRRAHRNNKSGLLGVSVHRSGYQADIWVNGKKRYLGIHETPEAAHAAYISAKREAHEGASL